jgi:uncharacterized membrane protein YdjX (TVP38/TMEM64 family)
VTKVIPLMPDRYEVKTSRWKIAMTAILIAGVTIAVWWLCFASGIGTRLLSFAMEREAEIRDWYQQSPQTVMLLVFLGYVGLTSLPLPGATAATLFTGWICGFTIGAFVVSFASTTAASLTFLATRQIVTQAIPVRFRQGALPLRKIPPEKVTEALFWLRLIPGIPFFAVNLGMGLTSIRLSRFWWVSQASMLPATLLYTYAGSRVPHLNEFAQHGISGILSAKLLICVVLLRCLPMLIRLVVMRAGKPKVPANPEP